MAIAAASLTTGPARHAEQVELHLAGVGHDRAAEHVAGAGHVGQAGGDQPAGDRLGQAERQPARRAAGRARPTPSSRRRRRRRSVAEDRRGPRPPTASSSAAAVVGGRGLGGEADLEPLPAAGQEGERRVAGVVERGRSRRARRSSSPLSLSPHVRSTRLTMTDGSPERRRRSGSTARSTISFISCGTPGHGVDDLAVADRADQPGRRAPGLGDDRRPDGHQRLAQVVVGHGPAARREHLADARRRPPRPGRSATPITSAIASRVMSSWVGPSPPHTITASAARQRRPQRVDDAGQVVAHLDLEVASRCRRRRAARRSRPSWCRRSGRAAARCRPRPRRTTSPWRHRRPRRSSIAGCGAAPAWPTRRARNRYCAPVTTVRTTATQSSALPQPAAIDRRRRQQREADGELLAQRLDLGQPASPARSRPWRPRTVR